MVKIRVRHKLIEVTIPRSPRQEPMHGALPLGSRRQRKGLDSVVDPGARRMCPVLVPRARSGHYPTVAGMRTMSLCSLDEDVRSQSVKPVTTPHRW
jgi:hypothetical protein